MAADALMPAAKRKRLLGKSRPTVRPFDPEWSGDMWVLWAAYDLGSFTNMPSGMTRTEFCETIKRIASAHSSCLVVEDDCKYFKAQRGPMCFVTVRNFGDWRIEPYAEFFKWATPRMRLRCAVAFFQMVRYSKEIGVCLVRVLADQVKLCRKMKGYFNGRTDQFVEVGRVPHGDPAGVEYLYSIRGAKHGT